MGYRKFLIGNGRGGRGGRINNYYQLPITNYQLPITNYRLPIIDYQCPMPHAPCPIPNYLLTKIESRRTNNK
ncbi:MAG: hypothetical protein WBF90_35660 [Rivularia sp. (in: cyanobacteria)]